MGIKPKASQIPVGHSNQLSYSSSCYEPEATKRSQLNHRWPPGAFDTWFRYCGVSHVFAMEAFKGQDVDYVADQLVHQGLEELLDVFKGIFSQI